MEEGKKSTQLSLKVLAKRIDELADSLNKPAIGNVNDLLTKINLLEKLVLRMAHNSGTAHTIIRESDLAPYVPGKEEMSKFARKVV